MGERADEELQDVEEAAKGRYKQDYVLKGGASAPSLGEGELGVGFSIRFVLPVVPLTQKSSAKSRGESAALVLVHLLQV
jgi:hypothetical protein